MYRGHVRDAEVHQLAALRAGAASGGLFEFRNTLTLAEIYLLRGNRARAEAAIARAESLATGLHLDPVYYLYLGDIELRAGRLERAQWAAGALAAVADTNRPADRVVVRALAALIANERGSPQPDLAIFPRDSTDRLNAFVLRARAEAFAATGRLDAAMGTAAQLATGWYYGSEPQIPWMAAPLALARYAEMNRDSSTARTALSQFIARWNDGDQDLPALVAARRALTRMQPAKKR
jgi:hypothetical protein